MRGMPMKGGMGEALLCGGVWPNGRRAPVRHCVMAGSARVREEANKRCLRLETLGESESAYRLHFSCLLVPPTVYGADPTGRLAPEAIEDQCCGVQSSKYVLGESTESLSYTSLCRFVCLFT